MAIIAYKFFVPELGWIRGSGRLSPTITPPPRVTGFYTIDFLLNVDSVGFFVAVVHLPLPVLVLSLFTIALLTRFILTSVLEVLDADFARPARAHGLTATPVVFSFVLRLFGITHV